MLDNSKNIQKNSKNVKMYSEIAEKVKQQRIIRKVVKRLIMVKMIKCIEKYCHKHPSACGIYDTM